MNAVDSDDVEFLQGDWRMTGHSTCAHECNHPVTGVGTIGQCDEGTSGVCEEGTDCGDCGVYNIDQGIATLSANDCHAHLSEACSEADSFGGWTGTGCAAFGIDTNTQEVIDDGTHEVIDPGQAIASCSISGSNSVSLTEKSAWRDGDTPTNMKNIDCDYYDRSAHNLHATSATFLRTLSTPLSSITCPPDASAARALVQQSTNPVRGSCKHLGAAATC